MKYKEIVKLWSDSRTAWFEYNISVGMAAGKVFKNIKEIMEVEDHGNQFLSKSGNKS